MTTLIIILSKVGLGGGGGLVGLIVFAIVCFYLWIQDDNDYGGCMGLILLPFLPFYLLYKGFEKLYLFEPKGNKFNSSPSMLLKVLVAFSVIGLCIMSIGLEVTYYNTFWSAILCVLFVPILLICLYMLWVKLFFVWLGRLRPKVAIIICVASILLVIAFSIATIKMYNYYTSFEYFNQYLNKKYGCFS